MSPSIFSRALSALIVFSCFADCSSEAYDASVSTSPRLLKSSKNQESEAPGFVTRKVANPDDTDGSKTPETWFGPLIKQVEERIIAQQGDKLDRELFEQHLMGYTMRTDRYRLVEWKDFRDKDKPAVFVELFDHETDPNETVNIAAQNPESLSV